MSAGLAAPGVVGVRVVGAVRVRVPLRRPLVTVRGTWRTCDAWLLRLTDAEGRTAVGEATLGPGADAGDQAALDDLLRSLVIDPGQVARLMAETARSDDTVVAAAGAAVETALLDLGRLLADRPRTASVRLNAMIGAESLHASVAAARSATADGFTTLKLKGGGEASTADLVERLLAVRAAVGPAVALRLDVNGAWDGATARDRLSALEPVGLEYVEQPVPPGATAVLAELRRQTDVAVAADEAVTSLGAARALLEADAVDVLVVKPARVGGPRQTLTIASLAAQAGVAVVISTLLETGVGLAAGLVTAAMLPEVVGPSPAHGLATGALLVSDLVRGAATIASGAASIPAGPGLGITIDEEAVDRHAVERLGAWR